MHKDDTLVTVGSTTISAASTPKLSGNTMLYYEDNRATLLPEPSTTDCPPQRHNGSSADPRLADTSNTTDATWRITPPTTTDKTALNERIPREHREAWAL